MNVPTIIWIATATLHKLHPNRTSFTTKEIRDVIIDQGLRPEIAITTINVYLTSYAVSTSPVLVDNVRYLLKLTRGVYRLWADGDNYHESRKDGRKYPTSERLGEFASLLDWYFNTYVPNRGKYEQPDQPPSIITESYDLTSKQQLRVVDHINVVDEMATDILKFSVTYNSRSGEIGNRVQLNITNQKERDAALKQIKALIKIVEEPI